MLRRFLRHEDIHDNISVLVNRISEALSHFLVSYYYRVFTLDLTKWRSQVMGIIQIDRVVNRTNVEARELKTGIENVTERLEARTNWARSIAILLTFEFTGFG